SGATSRELEAVDQDPEPADALAVGLRLSAPVPKCSESRRSGIPAASACDLCRDATGEQLPPPRGVAGECDRSDANDRADGQASDGGAEAGLRCPAARGAELQHPLRRILPAAAARYIQAKSRCGAGRL